MIEDTVFKGFNIFVINNEKKFDKNKLDIIGLELV